jgi:hypothetical protein
LYCIVLYCIVLYARVQRLFFLMKIFEKRNENKGFSRGYA